eukprot:203717-Prymnesium_polylepis.1
MPTALAKVHRRSSSIHGMATLRLLLFNRTERPVRTAHDTPVATTGLAMRWLGAAHRPGGDAQRWLRAANGAERGRRVERRDGPRGGRCAR